MCSVKKVFLEISQNSQENTCARVSLLIKLPTKAWNFIKKRDPNTGVSCEFCKISKSAFSYRRFPWVASDNKIFQNVKFHSINAFGIRLKHFC